MISSEIILSPRLNKYLLFETKKMDRDSEKIKYPNRSSGEGKKSKAKLNTMNNFFKSHLYCLNPEFGKSSTFNQFNYQYQMKFHQLQKRTQNKAEIENQSFITEKQNPIFKVQMLHFP